MKENEKEKSFTWEKDNDFDYILQEGQNTSICLRKISWNGRPYKIDIRKYTYQDSTEHMGKGVSLTDEATNILVETLVDNNYGDTKKILKGLKNRPDFNDAVVNMDAADGYDDDGSEEYYDPAELLGIQEG